MKSTFITTFMTISLLFGYVYFDNNKEKIKKFKEGNFKAISVPYHLFGRLAFYKYRSEFYNADGIIISHFPLPYMTIIRDRNCDGIVDEIEKINILNKKNSLKKRRGGLETYFKEADKILKNTKKRFVNF